MDAKETSATLIAGTDPWGIETGYTDALGHWHDTPEPVRATLRRSMGVEEMLPDPPPPQAVRLMAHGQGLDCEEPVLLRLEDGTERQVEDRVPKDLPSGYHQMSPPDGSTPGIPFLVHPPHCPETPPGKTWGWVVQLYSVRSAGSWGIGDLADLRRLGVWASGLGAGFLQINPLFAAQPIPPIEASPYYPSTRRFLNPIYLRIEEVPGAAESAGELESLAARGRALNRLPLIDRDTVFKLKMEALEKLWAHFNGHHAFEKFVVEGGEDLRQYATYCILAESHGSNWRTWPVPLRHPTSPAVARFAEERKDRLYFHLWVQWLLDTQLEEAAQSIGLLQDLPIGFDPAGADAWSWQDLLTLDASIGAPPDEFNTLGQNWGLPPFIPYKLRETGYAPLRSTLRSVLRHARGLRVDHVMGLFRLYWIPNGEGAGMGAYVRYPHEEILAVFAIECERANAFAVGEDLGTVEPLVREAMTRWNVLSSKVMWFEKIPPSEFPRQSLATLSTHDLPTLAGQWDGSDLAEQLALGRPGSDDAMRPAMERLRYMASVPADADAHEAIRRIHHALGQSPSALVAASLEDALGVSPRPNLPGTSLERPNWRIALPVSLEALETHPLALSVAQALKGET